MARVYEILKVMFSWPNGIVVGNLLASLIWQPWALRHMHKKVHAKLDQHHQEHINAIQERQTETIHVRQTSKDSETMG